MSSTLSSPAIRTPVSQGAARSRRLGGMLTLPEVRWAAVATALFAVGGLSQLLGAPAAVYWPLYLACYAAGGWEPALAGLQALRAKTLDVDLLMIVAAIVAAAIGQVLDGALLIVIFSTSGALEAFATKRTQDSVKALLDLAPEQATRLLEGGTKNRSTPRFSRWAIWSWCGPVSGSGPTGTSWTGPRMSTRRASPVSRSRWSSRPATRSSPGP